MIICVLLNVMTPGSKGNKLSLSFLTNFTKYSSFLYNVKNREQSCLKLLSYLPIHNHVFRINPISSPDELQILLLVLKITDFWPFVYYYVLPCINGVYNASKLLKPHIYYKKSILATQMLAAKSDITD